MVRYNMCTPATDVKLDNPEVDMTAYVFEPSLHVQIEEFSPSSFSSVDRVHTSRDLLLEIYIIPHARYMHRQIDVENDYFPWMCASALLISYLLLCVTCRGHHGKSIFSDEPVEISFTRL